MAGKPLPPEELGPRLAEVYSVVGPLYRRAVRAIEQHPSQKGIPVAVRALLEYLDRTGRAATVPQIARSLGLSRQFVQRTVNQARQQEFVELLPNPAHRRSPLIGLTATGHATFTAVEQREQQLLGRIASDITDTDVEATLRVLRTMLAALEDIELD
ncbi:MarR family winged helix-turn-helix transcriptional regulator [Saccharopolyspora rectivirgula]|jgi:DNA-binding MarR family transcriptional regulator|uniref:MarR family transcriptional regulator n=1 Tax=Saccharopolyspora rectivirgula TaxID=28042 RepID=A0A073AZM9_9PSEU|nr:helix-turn-helix domain-containing protein [Saccharopolyspora rectivirgula]KEI44845.1 MarR family transcriptional regulator [Saccharopolyspora rectivirgula]